MNEISSKKKLLLITDEFPFGNGEPFLIPEIPHLAEKFSVTLVSSDTTSPLQRNLPAAIPVHRLRYTLTVIEKIKYGCLFLGNKVCRQELVSILRIKSLRIRRIKQSILAYSQGSMWYRSLEQLKVFEEQDILYFYWYNPKLIGTALAMRKMQNRPVIFCRLHGYDLYNEREVWTRRQPFKPVLDSYVDHLFFVSNVGYNYYKTTFGFKNPRQYSVSYLGTENHFGVSLPHPGSSFALVSCSNVIPLKRVELIIKALALVDSFSVSWTHLGGGSSLESVIELARLTLGEKENIAFTFTGQVQNSQIHDYYQNHGIDCFILASETEGCPVSIQEAMSYGIPIIGTSVGEIPIMIDNNGFLLPANPTDMQVYGAIESMLDAKNSGKMQEMRDNSRQIWEKHFNADINFLYFAQEIDKLES